MTQQIPTGRQKGGGARGGAAVGADDEEKEEEEEDTCVGVCMGVGTLRSNTNSPWPRPATLSISADDGLQQCNVEQHGGYDTEEHELSIPRPIGPRLRLMAGRLSGIKPCGRTAPRKFSVTKPSGLQWLT